MREVFLITKKRHSTSLKVDYVYSTPKNVSGVSASGRYVKTTRYLNNAKVYESREAAYLELAKFAEINFLASWNVIKLWKDDSSLATV